jgi:hypothetical protein
VVARMKAAAMILCMAQTPLTDAQINRDITSVEIKRSHTHTKDHTS